MAKKKKASKKPSQTDGIELTPENQVKYLNGQLQALHLQLEQKVESTTLIQEEYNNLMKDYKSEQEQLKQERERNESVTRDMTRQYKGMKDTLLEKLNERENRIQELNEIIFQTKEQNQIDMEEKNKALREKEDAILRLKEQMDQNTMEFLNMMKSLSSALLKNLDPRQYEKGKVALLELLGAPEYSYKTSK